MTVDKCPRCGRADTLRVQDYPEKIVTYCQRALGGCARRVVEKKQQKTRGRKPLGAQRLTVAEKGARCIPKLPYARGNTTWYVVSTLVDDGSTAVFKCLEWGTLRSLEKRYPDDQVLAVRRYPAAKQREFAAMIEQAQEKES